MRRITISALLASALSIALIWGTAASDYLVGKGDVISVDVFKEKDFSGDFTIDPKGNLNYPVVGEISVEGKKIDEVKELLTAVLAKDYLVNPKVAVSVKQYNSKKVTVVGAVGRPGIYVLTEQTRLLDLISLAGGINRDGSTRVVLLRREKKETDDSMSRPAGELEKPANVEDQKEPSADMLKGESIVNAPSVPSTSAGQVAGSQTSEVTSGSVSKELPAGAIAQPTAPLSKEPLTGTTVAAVLPESQTSGDKEKETAGFELKLPPNSGNLTPIVVDYGKILQGDLSNNIEMQAGDIINIPKANEIFVLGSVRNPGPVKFEDGMGVLQAVTLAGGPAPEASQGSTYIMRMEPGKKEEKIKVNLGKILKQKAKNVDVKPNDVIVIPESFF